MDLDRIWWIYDRALIMSASGTCRSGMRGEDKVTIQRG